MAFAANFVLLPYYTFNYLVSSGGDGQRSPLADNSLLVLLILIHYRKCVSVDEFISNNNVEGGDANAYLKDNSTFHDNPYCKALENARDIECKSLFYLVKISFRSIIELSIIRKCFFWCS